MRFTHGSRSRIQGDRVATSIRSMHSAVWLLAAVVVSLLAGSAPAFAQTIVSATGYSITFNGNQQAFFSNTWNGTSPQAPANIAWASGTGSAFALAAFGAGVHEIRFANDGVYGNNRSWMQQSLAPSAYIGVRFPAAQSLSSIAWGRDNGRNDTAIASGGGGDTTGGGGQYTDRTSGSYTLQFTTVASPGTSTPDGDWTTIGTITLPSTASGEFSPWFRHEFDVRTAAGNPIAGVTGIRIFAPNAAGEGRVIDEIEAYRNAWWTGGSAVWSSTTAWQTAASGGTSATPYAGDSVVFAQTTSATQAVTLGADQAARTMSFTTADPVAITAGGFNRTLTLGWAGNLTTSSTVSTAGIAVAAGAGAVTIGSQTAGEQVALSLNASQTWTNDSSNTLTLRNAVSRVASDTTSRTLTIAGSGNTTINGPIANGGAAGTLALAKSGSGTLTLAGNNSLTGTVTISSGTLRFGDGGAGSGVAGPVVNNGALVINVSNTASFAGGISGTGAFIQSGNGTAYLTGTNTYTGRTTISGGVLQAVNPASLYGGTTANWTAANISTGSGATLAVSVGTSNFTAANVTTLLGNLGGLGGAVNNNGLRAGSTIGVDTSAAGGSFTLSDSIKDSTGTGGGSIGLTKFGTGTLILTGTNMFTGPTTVSQGTLQIGDGGTAGSLVGNVVNNASLVLNRSDSVTFPGLLSGTGSVVQAGAGSIVFGGSNAFAGVVAVDAGTVLVRNSSAFGTGRASVAAGGLLAVNASGGTVANDIALSGGTVTSFVATTGSGGSYSTTPDGLYGVHTFTATGTSTFSGYVGPVEVLLVGGGGGGGSSHGGGGGGGGFLDTTASAGLGGNPVVVGDGGAGGASGGQNNGGNGGTSSAFGLFAIGGGGGGMYTATATPGNGLNGGSGGGGGGSQTQSTAGAGTSGQGFGGGAGSTAGGAGGGGGGGGALATGSSASSRNGGQGGAGKTSSITGSSVTYAGGGGGGGWYTSGTLGATSGAGGAGGGGAGGNGSNVRGVNGTNGLGGGGGGGTDYTPGGGNGGSGIVIVRYALSSIVNDLQTLSGSVTVNATSTLDAVRGSGGLRFTGGMSGAGGLTIASTGSGAAASVIFDGAAKSYAGPTLINAGGDLRVNSDNSLATGAVTVNGRLGGSGSLGGAVTVNSGGVLSPGNSIESLSTGAVSFTGGSTYEYEVDSSAALSVGADFTKALGNLSLSGSVALSLVDLAASPAEFAVGTTFSLFNYTGSWNNGLFTVSGSQVADDGTFTFGLNTWRLDYNATAGGSNYSSEYTTGSFVNIVVVPEPGAIALAGIGIAAALALRRRK